MGYHLEFSKSGKFQHRAAVFGDDIASAIRAAQDLLDKSPSAEATLYETPDFNAAQRQGVIVAEYTAGAEPEWTVAL